MATETVERSDQRVDIGVDELFSAYLSVYNRAIREVDEFWVRQAGRLHEAIWKETNYRTLIYDGDPDRIIGDFVLHFDPDSRKVGILPPGDHDIAFTWKIPLAHVRDVAITRPDWYAEHPMRLDWKWVSMRLGSELRSRIDGRGPLLAGGALVLGAVVAFALLRGRD